MPKPIPPANLVQPAAAQATAKPQAAPQQAKQPIAQSKPTQPPASPVKPSIVPSAPKPPTTAPVPSPAKPAAPISGTAAPQPPQPVAQVVPKPTQIQAQRPPGPPQPAGGMPTPPLAATQAPQPPQNPPAPVPTNIPVAPLPPRAPVAGPVKPQQSAVPQPIRIQQPPQTLTALSSMASNRLPSGAGAASQSTIPATGGGGTPPNKPMPAPLTATPQPPKAPQFVEPRKSPLRFLPFIGGAIVLLLVLGFVAFRFLGLGGSSTTSVSNTSNSQSNTTGGTTQGTTGQQAVQQTTGKKVSLEYWGLWEPTETMATVIKDYETANPGVTIKYNKQSHKDFRTRLQNALGSENGPDIFRYHASWVPMLKQNLAALPSSIFSASDYQNTFYPVAVSQLQVNGQLVGIPLMYDGLELFYNTDVFQTAVLEPPKTWADLRTAATKLTVKEGSTIKRAGIAMGNTVNVEHFSDILGVLMLQNGADLTKADSAEVRDALLFYSNFIKTDGVWDDSLPSSTVAFARGDVAMMFAPSWRAHEIIAMNPDLKFATAPLPQLSEERIAWATYWAEGVNTKSANKDESWKFLKYLSSKEVQQKLYASQAETRTFGELYSRRDLADTLAKDPKLSAFVQDAPYAKGWHLSSYTHDTGLNDQLIQYYKDAINSLLVGKQVEEVQKTLDQGVSQVVRQYGVTSNQPAK